MITMVYNGVKLVLGSLDGSSIDTPDVKLVQTGTTLVGSGNVKFHDSYQLDWSKTGVSVPYADRVKDLMRSSSFSDPDSHWTIDVGTGDVWEADGRMSFGSIKPIDDQIQHAFEDFDQDYDWE